MDKPTIIYILGVGHCGSTLLDLMLGSHPQIFGAGEVYNLSSSKNDLEKKICTCQKKASECDFWQCVYQKTPKFKESGLKGLRLHTNKFNFLLRKTWPDNYTELNEEIYQAISYCSGKKFIVDSSKYPHRAEALLNSQNLKIILVHLIRDGRGVMWSYKRKREGSLGPLLRWLLRNIKIEVVKKRNKSAKILTVRYEDLVKKPKETLEKILAPLGLSYEPAMLNFSPAGQHQIEGNRLRFNADGALKEDLSWRDNLSWPDKIAFWILAGWLNKLYGY